MKEGLNRSLEVCRIKKWTLIKKVRRRREMWLVSLSLKIDEIQRQEHTRENRDNLLINAVTRVKALCGRTS